ncbi:unnamed protein product, partial [Polarella glacialis]
MFLPGSPDPAPMTYHRPFREAPPSPTAGVDARMWEQRRSPSLLMPGSRQGSYGRSGRSSPNPSDVDELSRVVKRLAKRVELLETEGQELRGILQDSGFLNGSAFEVNVHRRRFAAVRRAHPCTWDASLTNVLVTKELLHLIARYVGQEWQEPALMLATSCRSSMFAAQHAIKEIAQFPLALYVCGGRDGQRCLNSVERLDPRRGEWEPCPVMLHHRAAAVAAHLDGLVYVCGGWSGRLYLNAVEAFDPKVGLWRK